MPAHAMPYSSHHYCVSHHSGFGDALSPSPTGGIYTTPKDWEDPDMLNIYQHHQQLSEQDQPHKLPPPQLPIAAAEPILDDFDIED